MSDKIAATLAALQAKLDEGDFDGSAKFDIQDTGIIRIVDGKVTTEDGPADVTISGDQETFEALLDGELSAAEAFMTQKIAIEGDMGVAMQLGGVLG